MTRLSLGSVFVALLIASPAPAQEDESIIVEGQRRSVTQIVKGTIQDAGVYPLARFEEKICPGIVGLSGAQAERLVQMIRENVAALGGKLDEPGCTANATTIFTDEPVEFVKKMAKTQPGYFDLSPRALDQFTAKPRAVASWHVTDTRARDGQELTGASKQSDHKRRLMNTQASVGTPIDARVVRQSAATRLYTNTREDMLVGFAVIDKNKSAGKSLRQLADLATLHLLLDVKQDAGEANRGSILALFEDRPVGVAPPVGLTETDRAMVHGLYAPKENNRTAAQQFSQIAAAVRKSAGEEQE